MSEATKAELDQVIGSDERPLNEVLAETMSETFDKANEEEEGEEAEKEEKTTAPEDKKENKEEAPPPEKEEQAASEESPDGDSGDDADKGREELSPPDHWAADEKETFGKLDREAQDFVLRRDRRVDQFLSKKSQEITEERRVNAELDQLVESRRQAWALQGMTPAGAIGQIVQLAEVAEADPAKFIQWFAEQRNVDLSTLGTEPDTDPVIAALHRRQDGLEQQFRSSAQQGELSAQQAAQAVIDAFKTENKHFEAVEQDLYATLPMVQRNNPAGTMETWLKEAYDRAIYANPTVRGEILADQKTAEDAERLKARKAEADKARKAAGTNISPRGAPSGESRKKGSIKDTMSEAYDKANAA